jgi:predicted alpha/beta-fold hydrolase
MVIPRAAPMAPGTAAIPIARRVEALFNLVTIPLLFPYTLVKTIMRWSRRNRPLPSEPTFQLEPTDERLTDIAAFAEVAENDPARPRFGWGSLDFQLQYAPDAISSVVDAYPSRAGRLFRCPPPFAYFQFESLDGTPLVGQVAVRDDRDRTGIVVVHGTFGSGGQALYANQAIEAYASWGFNVLALDLRGWGRSAALSDAVITSGWKEAEDILAAARYLKEHSRTTSVGVVGYSLGGGSGLRAATHELAPTLIDGGVLSESGFTDAGLVIQQLAEKPRVLDPRYLVYWIFKSGFRRKFDATGHRELNIANYADYVATRYGIDREGLWHHTNMLMDAQSVRVPFLQLHATDDWVVPVEQAERLRVAARGNRLVGVCVRKRGAHCAFARVMGRWRSDLARRFFCGVAGIRVEPRAPR